jgi:hypothetical protein
MVMGNKKNMLDFGLKSVKKNTCTLSLKMSTATMIWLIGNNCGGKYRGEIGDCSCSVCLACNECSDCGTCTTFHAWSVCLLAYCCYLDDSNVDYHATLMILMITIMLP